VTPKCEVMSCTRLAYPEDGGQKEEHAGVIMYRVVTGYNFEEMMRLLAAMFRGLPRLNTVKGKFAFISFSAR
jgi:hypothetical protein